MRMTGQIPGEVRMLQALLYMMKLNDDYKTKSGVLTGSRNGQGAEHLNVSEYSWSLGPTIAPRWRRRVHIIDPTQTHRAWQYWAVSRRCVLVGSIHVILGP